MPVDEHSALGGEVSDNIDPDVSEEERRDVRRIMRIFHRHKKHREKYDRNWLHYYKMFRGDQWSKKRPRYRHSEVINLIFQSIQSSVPLQTDVRPTLTFIPEEPADREFAEILNEVSQSDWERNNWLAQLTEVIYDAHFYGIGLSSMHYNPDLDYGIGGAVYRSEDPFYCYPDPNSCDVNEPRTRAFFTAEPMDTDIVKELAGPERAHLIKPDVRDLVRSSKAALNDVTYRTSNTAKDMPDITINPSTEDVMSNKTMLTTAWLYPSELEEVENEEPDPETGEVKKVFITKKKYPRGRKVIIASGIIIDDGEFEYEHGKIPFSRYVNYILPREFYGMSEVEQLESPQRTFNKTLNFVLDYLTLMGNPIWVVDTASGIDTDHLINQPGLVVEKEPGSEVRREAGVQLQPYVLQLIDRLQNYFNDVAGSTDVSRGATPGSVTAASAIEQLQEAARTRIRQKQRNLDGYIRDFGQQYVEIVLEKYTQSRVHRVINDADGARKYFRFNTRRDESGQLVGQIARFDHNGQVPPENIKEFLISGRFDVRVNTGSSLPFSIADRESKILNLFDRGIVDAKEVLETLDYPNKEAVLNRLKETAEAQAAQAEQGA